MINYIWSDRTWIEIIVKGAHGKACPFALIELLADRTRKSVETNKYGVAKVPVPSIPSFAIFLIEL